MNPRIPLAMCVSAFLAGCGGTSTNVNPATSAILSNAVRPAHAGPAFSVIIILPNGLRAHGAQATVESLKATTTVGKKQFVDVANSAPCPATDSSGTFGGCGVMADGTKSYDIRKSTFQFYSKAKAKGCVLAVAHFKGTITPSYPVSMTFKPVNTKTCWK